MVRMISLLWVAGLTHGLPEVGSLFQSTLQRGRYLESKQQSLAKLETTSHNSKSDESEHRGHIVAESDQSLHSLQSFATESDIEHDATKIYNIESVRTPGHFVDDDGNGTVRLTKGMPGNGALAQFKLIAKKDNVYNIESVKTPGYFLDDGYHGKIRLTKVLPADRIWAKFKLIARKDGTFNIESVKSPGYFLDDGSGNIRLTKKTPGDRVWGQFKLAKDAPLFYGIESVRNPGHFLHDSANGTVQFTKEAAAQKDVAETESQKESDTQTKIVKMTKVDTEESRQAAAREEREQAAAEKAVAHRAAEQKATRHKEKTAAENFAQLELVDEVDADATEAHQKAAALVMFVSRQQLQQNDVIAATDLDLMKDENQELVQRETEKVQAEKENVIEVGTEKGAMENVAKEPTVDEQQMLETSDSMSKSEVNEVAMIGDAVFQAQAQAAIDAQEQVAVAAEAKAHRLYELASSASRKRELSANAKSARVALREAEAEEEASARAGKAESAARAAEAELDAARRVRDADKSLVQEATTESEAVDLAKEATQTEANALALATRLADALTKSTLADTDAQDELMTESTDAVEVVAESDQEMTIEQPSASQDSEESSDNADLEAASVLREYGEIDLAAFLDSMPGDLQPEMDASDPEVNAPQTQLREVDFAVSDDVSIGSFQAERDENDPEMGTLQASKIVAEEESLGFDASEVQVAESQSASLPDVTKASDVPAAGASDDSSTLIQEGLGKSQADQAE